MDELLGTIGKLSPMLASFYAVAGEKHVTNASDVLGMPQSSVSRRIQSLEAALGVALVQPDGRGISLTASGEELFALLHRPLRELEATVATVLADANPRSGKVRFGFPLSLGSSTIPAMLAEFLGREPGMRLNLIQSPGAQLTRAIRDGQLDLAIVIPIPSGAPFTPLGLQPIHVNVSSGHRLASRKRLKLSELRDEAFVVNPSSYNLRELTESWCRDAGFTPRVSFEITEFDTLRSFVAHGLGVALLPDPDTPHPGVVQIPLIGDGYERSIGLISGSTRLTPPAQLLHDHIVERKSELGYAVV